jgi:lysozyme family protein
MLSNFEASLDAVLSHEGGYVNHPADPGGATNKGITIGTLKKVGIDVDGDGDSDIVDLKMLRRSDCAKVYKTFYWDCVKGDELPPGVDYAVFDLAVNSGVGRGAKFLQRALGVTEDGVIGPMTLIKVREQDPVALAQSICDIRMAFLKRVKNPKTGALLWTTFGRGWKARVDECRASSSKMAAARSSAVPPRTPHPIPTPAPVAAHGKGDLIRRPNFMDWLLRK